MLHEANTLQHFKLEGRDGTIGKAKDFYFDDVHWTVRYLVADTGNWLPGRQVLIPPRALTTARPGAGTIAVDLTKQQLEDCPPLASDLPVSRQYETVFYQHYGWPIYWGVPQLYPGSSFSLREAAAAEAPTQHDWDPHLRSCREVRGNHLAATDGGIGHIDDLIIDDESWIIRYLVVDTRNWWPGKKVVVAPQWIEPVSWRDSTVLLNVRLEVIKDAPAYDGPASLTREYEGRVYQHYQRKGYWVGGEAQVPEGHVH